jgi:hypothetical protein
MEGTLARASSPRANKALQRDARDSARPLSADTLGGARQMLRITTILALLSLAVAAAADDVSARRAVLLDELAQCLSTLPKDVEYLIHLVPRKMSSL